MATCAVVGEAIGSAAALSLDQNVTPRRLAHDHIGELHQSMVRADASIIGVLHEDPDDLALTAAVTASSTLTMLETQPAIDRYPLDTSVGMVIPVDPELSRVGVLLDATADTELVIDVFDTGHPQNYVPDTQVTSGRAHVHPGTTQWVDVDIAWRPATARNTFLVVHANPDIALHVTDAPEPGLLCFSYRERPQDTEYNQPLMEWPKLTDRRTFCVRTAPATYAYAAHQAVGGYARPYGGPQLWASQVWDGPQWLHLRWPEPVTVGQIELVFNDDVNEYLINLHHHRTPDDVLPTLIRDYRVEIAQPGGDWQMVAAAWDNRWRRRVHRLDDPVSAEALRVVMLATNGAHRAQVVSVRAYPPRAS